MDYPNLTRKLAQKLDHPFAPLDRQKNYKKLSHLLLELLYNYLNTISVDRPLPREVLLAHIVVIAKPEKDPTICQNYHPISLLNTDTNIFF